MQDTALVLIDIQQGFDDPKWGRRNNPRAEKQAALLLNFFRQNNLLLYHIQHLSTEPDSPLRPEKPGSKIKILVEPKKGEVVINKNVNSAFIGTDLKQRLEKNKIRSVVFAGLTTDHCVSTTARMAGNYGFKVIVISDATATFERTFKGKHFSAKVMHEIALASLNNEFAQIMTTKEFLSSF